VNSSCGLQGLNRGAVVNVVNFVQYSLARLDSDSDYDPFYEGGGAFEDTRTELVRTEIQPNGSPFSGTTELVAEYAVDLKFGVTAIQTPAPRSLIRLEEGDDSLSTFAGTPSAEGDDANPQWIRTVHARLAVRSREGDRGGDVPSDIAPLIGMYRVPLDEGNAPFARVRTLQADIALRNNYEALWGP
jgi:hypothetical protein